jgi:hypothetical protein
MNANPSIGYKILCVIPMETSRVIEAMKYTMNANPSIVYKIHCVIPMEASRVIQAALNKGIKAQARAVQS